MITRAFVVVATLGGVAALAHADAAKAAKLLRDGRALEAKDPKAAQAKLTAALAESPNDATIMAELGYAALLAKDYATAETMTKKAIAAATDTKVKAAATWNLGDILAAKGDKAGADAAHAESKKLRETAKAEAARGSFDPITTNWAPAKMDGPFKDDKAFCAHWTKHKDDGDAMFKMPAGAEVGCDFDDAEATKLDGHTLRTVHAGWFTEERIHRTWHYLAVQLADGWYVGKLDQIISAGGTGEGNMALDMGKVELVELGPGGAKAIAIREHMSVTDTDEHDFHPERTDDSLTVCGIGKSGKPSCVGPIQIAGSNRVLDDDDRPKKGERDEAWGVTATFPKDGTIVFASDKKKKQAPPDAKLVGAHPIAFP